MDAGENLAGRDVDADRPGYAELEAVVARLEERIAEQDKVIAERDKVIAELRARLGKNPRNSSKPPSSEGYSKPSADKKKRSLRKRSGRKPGGQSGHEGTHLERVEVPNAEALHEPEGCEGCGGDLAGAERLEDGEESRQVFDLPEAIVLWVIAHVAVRRLCKGCGQISTGRFPRGVTAPVQYGPCARWVSICTSFSTSRMTAPASSSLTWRAPRCRPAP